MTQPRSLLLFLITIFTLLPFRPASAQTPPPSTTLTTQSRPAFPITIAETAPKETKSTAATLADYLHRISGATFEIKLGDGTQGIAVGTPLDFPVLKLDGEFAPNEPKRREEYILRSHPGGLYLIGATPLAVRHAVWDFLGRLGYRQFFPGPHWEIVPRNPDITVSLAVKEHPDYLARRIWYGFGMWSGDSARYDEWTQRNRMANGIDLHSEHAYTGIITANKAEFTAHPEYVAKPGGTKFVVSNPGLRELVTKFALEYFEKNPKADSISMEPSDLGGWDSDTNPDSKQFATISDRAVTLANTVAEAVNEKYPGKYVGIYAYSFHAAPPTIRVHPNVIVSVATALIQGHSVDELVEGWSRQGAALGMREYYSVNQWDRDLPGRSRGSNLDYLKNSIPRYYRSGARFMSAEASDNWAPNGLGYYIASRLLWHVEDAEHVPELVDDFLTKCFGPAKAPMAKFYALIDGSNRTPFGEEVVGQAYRLLDEARRLAADDATRQRIDDLVLYARYLELFRAYSTATGPARQAAFEQLARYVYRIHGSGMVYSLALYRDLDRRDKSVTMPAEALWTVGEKKNPWKSTEPVTTEEITTWLRDGVANNKIADYVKAEYSTDLVPAAPLELTVPANVVKSGPMQTLRGSRRFYLWAPRAGKLEFMVKGGVIGKLGGQAKLRLLSNEDGKVLDSGEVPSDRTERPLTLSAPAAGLYQLLVIANANGAEVRWPAEVSLIMTATSKAPAMSGNRWNRFFYVPRGTKLVAGFAGGPGGIRNAEGKIVFGGFNTGSGYFSLSVPPGQDGRLWMFEKCIGGRILFTVPPYVATSPEQLLLPREVVEADSRR